MYLEDYVGWSDLNEALAVHLVATVRQLACPWVLSLDANMEPEELMSNAVLGRLRMIVVAPERGACRHKDNWRKYDYFLVDSRLQRWQPIAVVCHE